MSQPSNKINDSRSAQAWMFGVIGTLLAIVAFRGALFELFRRWTTQEEYSHGFLIPVIAAWLLWQRREALSSSIDRPSWSGPSLIVLAMLVHIVGQLSAMFILSQVAFVIVLLGIALSIGGRTLLGAVIVPIGFLLFAIPLPYFLDASLSLKLQLISSLLGVSVARLFQIPVYLEGNIIDLGSYKLQVVDACSGLRYLFPLVSLSFLAAYLFRAPIWQRALVLLSSIPITVAMNGFRIGLVAVTVDWWGPQMAEGVLHFFEGWMIFVASALLLAIELSLLARISGISLFEALGAPKDIVQRTSQPTRRAIRHAPLYACLTLILAVLVTGSLIGSRTEVLPARNRFVTFPTQLGQWHGQTSLLEADTERGLAFEDYILSDYSDAEHKVINLYVAYYSSQRAGESPHSPLVCIPGSGWSITKFERTSAGPDHQINRAVIEQNGSRQLVYYWYEERGRAIASEYWSKWYLLYDAVTKNRSDGALVRLVTKLSPNELERDADLRLQSFIHDLRPVLAAYLPSGNATKALALGYALEHRNSGNLQ
jgi:exosortase D (VPLPA-CTERM-specific)